MKICVENNVLSEELAVFYLLSQLRLENMGYFDQLKIEECPKEMEAEQGIK